MGFKDQKIIAGLALLLLAFPLSAQNGNGQRDSLVRLIKGTSLQLIQKNGVNYRKAVDATFFHNNTYLICDTALWNVDSRVINAEGNVQVVQDGTKLTSDKLDYYIDQDLVQFRGSVVQLEDKDRNTLRTRYLDYNTRDSLALFRNGGAMKDKDGQIIESTDGSYDAKQRLFHFQGNVNMFTDSVFIKTAVIDYESAASRAVFNSPTDFWKEDNMLSARQGWYDRLVETFFFTGSVHATSKEQEAWCDSLFYYRSTGDIHLLGNAQVQDTTRNVAALAGSIFYVDSLSKVTLSREAAVALKTEEERRRLVDRWDSTAMAFVRDTMKTVQADTLYFGADTLVYRTIPKYLISKDEFAAAKSRTEEMMSDPVREFRRKAAEAAAQAAAQAAEANAESNPELAARAAARTASAGKAAVPPKPSEDRPVPETPSEDDIDSDDIDAPASAPADSTALPDSTASVIPGDRRNLPDSLASADSFGPDGPRDDMAPADSTAVAVDSLAVAVDSLALVPPDSTKIGFLDARGRVKIFRYDLQVACDSLRYCELDSIARLYIDPMVWNEGNRQYSADSIAVLVKGNAIDRASLMSNAFIITQETPELFDQIRSTEVMAYFDTTSALRRFDALGGANALFFLKEKEEFATANKVETKMLSALFADGDLRSIYYFESPKNDAWPVPQLKESERRMKGFNWQPDRKPQGKEDITPLCVRPSERSAYSKHPRTRFVQTDMYFPGYMKKVYAAIEAAKNRPSKAPAKAGVPADTPSEAPASVDSLALVPGDAGASKDRQSAGTAPADSLAAASDSLSTAGAKASSADSVAVAERPSPGDSVAATPPSPTKAELRAKAREERIAAREARWAVKDSLDAAKLKAKEDRKLARRKAQEAKALEKQRIQDERDAEKLNKYVARYRARKERKLKKQKKYGKTPGPLPEVHPDGHPEQRGLPDPTLDRQAVESLETPVPGVE